MKELKAKSVSGDFKPTPTVSVKEKAGTFFEGKLAAYKEIASAYEHPWNVYDFEVKDTDMSITVRKDKGEYVEASITPGETVALFAPTRLHNILKDQPVGASLRIEYLGMVKAGKKGGKAHSYKVFAL